MAVVRSFSAVTAVATSTYVDPEFCVIDEVPVIALPGESPISPVIVVGPVSVIALPASTAKVVAVPRGTVAVAATADWVPKAAKVMNAIPVTNMVEKESRRVSGTVR